jgi:hypothetical protein
MNPKHRPAMLRAAEDQVFKYDQIIVDLENGDCTISDALECWRSRSCSFCQVSFTLADNIRLDCPDCLLSAGKVGSENCIWDEAALELTRMLATPPRTRAKLIKALKARRDWLLKRIEDNGVILVDA